VRGASLAGSGEGAQLEFHSSLALSFDRVSASLNAVCAHAQVAFLPTGYHLPVIHTALVDGRFPAAAPPDDDDDDDDTTTTRPTRPCCTILTLLTRPRTHTPRAPFQR
jgi:hypothetical protein